MILYLNTVHKSCTQNNVVNVILELSQKDIDKHDYKCNYCSN